MAEQNGRWVTVNGAHVFIKDGETPDFSKNRGLQKTVKEENKYDQEYKRLEKNINDLMEKDIDEGTFLSMRARIIENIRKSDNPKYETLLGKFEKYAQEKLGYTPEDIMKMDEQGIHTDVRPSLHKYNAHPIGNKSGDRKLEDLFHVAQKEDLDFERMINFEMNRSLADEKEFHVAGRTYKKVGNNKWEMWEKGKRIWTGTNRSVANDISQIYE